MGYTNRTSGLVSLMRTIKKGVQQMVIQIATGIFVGFLFLGIFVGVLLGIAYIVGKNSDDVPRFIEEPKKRKHTHASVQDWWDRFDEED